MSLQYLKDEDINLTYIRSIDDVKPCENYNTLWQQLRVLNIPAANTSKKHIYSPNESYRVKILKENTVNRLPEVLEKELYGIVVEYKHNKGLDPEIYVDVPSKFLQPTNHPDDYIDETTGRSVTNICRFFPDNDDIGRRIIPQIGSIARIKVAPNFPNHSENNSKANRFIGSVANNIPFVPPKNIKAGFTKKNSAFLKNSIDKTQPIPEIKVIEQNISNIGTPASMPTNRPKMLLVDFECDFATRASLGANRGNQYIKIREDIYSDLYYIKNILNVYGIPFSCINLNIGLLNKDISDLARVGLEINLNQYCALTKNFIEDKEDYFVGPDINFPVGKFYRLKLYGNVKRNATTDVKYKPINTEIPIYNISDTFSVKEPKIIKIFRPVIDITEIFNDLGYKQYIPDLEFYKKSNNIKSYWNIFYKPIKIPLGYTYKELLQTVYYNNNESIWQEKEKYWNGDTFEWLAKK